nr:serine protease [Roseateles oligotrophus]
MNVFAEQENALHDLPGLIQRAKKSVLLVGTYGETDSPRFLFRGTGFVAATNNLIVTNAHVLPDVADIGASRRLVVQVPSGDGRWALREVAILQLDRERDLALLRVDGAALPPLVLALDGEAQEGTSIAFMGFPIGGALGFSFVTHRGIVSSIAPIALPQVGAQVLSEKSIRKIREGSFNILQLDATAYPGNSGGPVFDVVSGKVVGVINMVLTKGSRESALTSPSGISYAIPIEFVRRLITAER